MIKAIIFDFGGVINKLGNLKKSLDKINLKTVDEYQKFIDFSNESFNKSHLYEVDDLFDAIREFYRIELTNKEICKLTIEPNDEVIELVKKLSKNYDLYILTSIHKDLMNVFLQERPIGNYFKKIVETYKEHLSKKDLNLYKRLMDKIGYKPEEILFIDDGQKNLDLASSLGIKTILFQSAEELNKSLLEYEVKI